VAHGYVAWRKGDDTARMLGRLSLNPLVHIDPFGTVILPLVFYFSFGFIFAFAKPVPVNFLALRRPKEDMVWVAAAGPATNFALAGLSVLILKILEVVFPDTTANLTFVMSSHIPSSASPVLFPIIGMLYFSVVFNSILALINLIPIPPADGGRIMVGLLPQKAAIAYSRIEPFGMILLIVLIMFDPLGIVHEVISLLLGNIVRILL
jgi:Zn-dependent protease